MLSMKRSTSWPSKFRKGKKNIQDIYKKYARNMQEICKICQKYAILILPSQFTTDCEGVREACEM